MINDNQDALRCADAITASGQFTDVPTLDKSAAHLRRLVAENEAKDALLRQAVEAWYYEQSMRSAIAAIRQHLEGRA